MISGTKPMGNPPQLWVVFSGGDSDVNYFFTPSTVGSVTALNWIQEALRTNFTQKNAPILCRNHPQESHKWVVKSSLKNSFATGGTRVRLGNTPFLSLLKVPNFSALCLKQQRNIDPLPRLVVDQWSFGS